MIRIASVFLALVVFSLTSCVQGLNLKVDCYKRSGLTTTEINNVQGTMEIKDIKSKAAEKCGIDLADLTLINGDGSTQLQESRPFTLNDYKIKDGGKIYAFIDLEDEALDVQMNLIAAYGRTKVSYLDIRWISIGCPRYITEYQWDISYSYDVYPLAIRKMYMCLVG